MNDKFNLGGLYYEFVSVDRIPVIMTYQFVKMRSEFLVFEPVYENAAGHREENALDRFMTMNELKAALTSPDYRPTIRSRLGPGKQPT